jgi:hypothetical protein
MRVVDLDIGASKSDNLRYPNSGGCLSGEFWRPSSREHFTISCIPSRRRGWQRAACFPYSFDPWGLRHPAEVRGREHRIGWVARLGLLRFCVTPFPAHFDPVKGVRPDARDEMRALYLRSSRHFATADEMYRIA